MNGKHTKGKWEIRRWGKNGEEIFIGAQYNICSMLYTGHPADIEANARLIAAAPELLAACKIALPFLQEYRERVIKGRIEGELLSGDYTITHMLGAAIEAAEGGITP